MTFPYCRLFVGFMVPLWRPWRLSMFRTLRLIDRRDGGTLNVRTFNDDAFNAEDQRAQAIRELEALKARWEASHFGYDLEIIDPVEEERKARRTEAEGLTRANPHCHAQRRAEWDAFYAGRPFDVVPQGAQPSYDRPNGITDPDHEDYFGPAYRAEA